MSSLFTQLEVDSGAGSSNDIKTRVPNIAVEITLGFRLCLEFEEHHAVF